MPRTKQNVPKYQTQAILLTILCCLAFGRVAIFCLLFGIVAIVYAAQVNTRLELGDDLGAVEASKNAKKWYSLSLIAALITTAIAIVLYYTVLSYCNCQFFLSLLKFSIYQILIFNF